MGNGDGVVEALPRAKKIVIARDGVEIIPTVLAPPEVADLLHHLACSDLKRSRAGLRHLMRDETIFALARDSRLLRLSDSALGARATPFRATLFDKSNSANWLVGWHQDTALPLQKKLNLDGWGPWSIKGWN